MDATAYLLERSGDILGAFKLIREVCDVTCNHAKFMRKAEGYALHLVYTSSCGHLHVTDTSILSSLLLVYPFLGSPFLSSSPLSLPLPLSATRPDSREGIGGC